MYTVPSKVIEMAKLIRLFCCTLKTFRFKIKAGYEMKTQNLYHMAQILSEQKYWNR